MTKDEALKMAIEVLWSVEEYDETGVNIAKKAINACKEALEQPAQEPVEYLGALPNVDGSVNLYFKKDQWQGLTDDEIDNAWSGVTKYGISGVDFTVRFARAIEQALKDKNT